MRNNDCMIGKKSNHKFALSIQMIITSSKAGSQACLKLHASIQEFGGQGHSSADSEPSHIIAPEPPGGSIGIKTMPDGADQQI